MGFAKLQILAVFQNTTGPQETSNFDLRCGGAARHKRHSLQAQSLLLDELAVHDPR